MKSVIRRNSVFPGQSQKRLDIILNIIRIEPAMILLEALAHRSNISHYSLTNVLKTSFPNFPTPYLVYLNNIILPSALVSEIDITGIKKTYTMEKSGYSHGIPSVDFALKYSAENDLWLGDVLGRNPNITGIKTSNRRYGILEQAHYNQGRTIKQLSTNLQEKEKEISADVEVLIKEGFLDYDSGKLSPAEKGNNYWNTFFRPLHNFLADRIKLLEISRDSFHYQQRALEIFLNRTK